MSECNFCNEQIPDDVPFTYYGDSFPMCDDCITYDDLDKENA
jgi:hypothetical protein